MEMGRQVANAANVSRSGANLNRMLVVLAVLSASLATTGCTLYPHVDEYPVSQPLQPMPEPDWDVGTTWYFLEKWRPVDYGREYWERIEAHRGERHVTADSIGCTMTRSDWFEPAVHSLGCYRGGVGVKREVTRTGDPWPLEVGKSWQYTTSGVNSRGYRWKRRDYWCLVEAQVRVVIPAGGFDTFKVVCESRRWKGTWYVAPSLGTYALYVDDPDLIEITRYEYLKTDMTESSPTRMRRGTRRL